LVISIGDNMRKFNIYFLTLARENEIPCKISSEVKKMIHERVMLKELEGTVELSDEDVKTFLTRERTGFDTYDGCQHGWAYQHQTNKAVRELKELYIKTGFTGDEIKYRNVKKDMDEAFFKKFGIFVVAGSYYEFIEVKE